MSTGIKLNILMDHEIRQEIITFVREQVRPLVKEAFSDIRGKTDHAFANLFSSENFKVVLKQCITDIFQTRFQTERWGAATVSMKETMEQVIKPVADNWFKENIHLLSLEALKPYVRELVREELKAIIGSKI